MQPRLKNVRIWAPVFGDDEDDKKKKDDTAEFTPTQQARINTLLADQKREFQRKTQESLTEINALRQRNDLTSKEREELDHKVEELQNNLSSKEEIATRERRELERKHEHTAETLQKQVTNVTQKYEDSLIAREISDAATLHKGVNPKHFKAILQPMAKVVAPKDDEGALLEGKPDVVVISFPDKDKDGKDIVLNLSANDAVKRMSEIGEHQTLFKGKGTGGLGDTTIKVPGEGQHYSELAKSNPAAYRKARMSGEISDDDL